MGSFLSSAGIKRSANECDTVSLNEACKRQRMSSSFHDDNLRLIPNLPNEISIQILARVPRMFYLNARLVSRSWKATIMSSELYDLRKELGTTEEWLYLLTKANEDKLFWHALDPISRQWQRLPLMPTLVIEESRKGSFGLLKNMFGSSAIIGDVMKGWLGWKDELDHVPYCGCSIGAVDGCLYVLGGFCRASAVKSVWRYDPIANAWGEVNSMSTGRAYCKTGILNNKLYVVGGVSRGRGGLTPLQSAEAFDPCTGSWSQVPSMPFSRAQVLPSAFLADMLKPIATGMTPYRGRLCVPQSLYSWPFFVDVGGEVYDPETNSWVEMPTGMGEGWPARQAGTKVSIVVDGELYSFDPSSTLDNGRIKVYDQEEDAWKVVIRKVPSFEFSDSEFPYLLAGFHGKLHFITRTDHKISVLQADVRDNIGSSSSSPSMTPSGCSCEQSDSEADSDTVVWKVISDRDFGSAELVSCQVLDV